MGAWGCGAFDNDNAADFTVDLDLCPTLEARSDLLMATLRTVAEKEAGSFDLAEFDHQIDHAIAAAAYVADAKSGQKRFTDTVYAQGLNDETDEFYTILLETPSPELINMAKAALEKIDLWMDETGAEGQWAATVGAILAHLQ
jgi:hypothetical protein